MAERNGPTPLTFYLNEQHELSRGEKEGGGRVPQYHGINWATKGQHISAALESVKSGILASKDPVRDSHYFVLAKPVAEIQKKSKNKKIAPTGIVTEPVRFEERESRVFRRLGIDLVEVTESGDAVVHIRPERLEQLLSTTRMLDEAGAREQARWASVDSFGLVPPSLRIDDSWVRSLQVHKSAEAVVEFQPLLTRSDIDSLIRSITALLKHERREAITGIGTDFSGRNWARGRITPESLRAIAKVFYSVQTLHSPLTSLVVSTKKQVKVKSPPAAPSVKAVDVSTLPTVAILDTGVPADHSILVKFRRGGYVAPDSIGTPVGDHGSFVASRVVFGDPDFGDGPPTTPAGQCRYYDALVATSGSDIDDKSVVPSLQAIVATAPDVRVFNLSFDTRPLDLLEFTKRRENLLLVQDLDNLVFRDDLFVVVSAGNSPPGVQPNQPYPGHFDDPEWHLGAWARSYNSVTCGSFVKKLSVGGLVTTQGWPSPFTRVGPGLCESPKPDFSDNGGNSTPAMQYAPGLGVWGLTAGSHWEDRCGTSYAAPMLAREAAFALNQLQRVCVQGARPYAVTAKAFLSLTAIPPAASGAAQALGLRSLGRGLARSTRLLKPRADTAILLWQGVLEGPNDIARVTLPIPLAWYKSCTAPRLRLVVAWDPPVNAAVSGLWATRKIAVHLKASPDAQSLHGTKGGHLSYPMIDRTYDLHKVPKGASVEGDIWMVELSYDQTADYHLGMAFTPQQRVAFAAELYDDGEQPLSPQSALQALPSAVTMTRLSVPPQSVKTAVIIKPIG
ncbi:MAG TPA: S8 family serine peptidase [Verrucomicrobiae bacterium]|nr:S8 family serine peptidase [Verrucomicrobiae bacterium]